MSDPKKPCDLCSLPVGVKPFTLAASGNTLEFCCEGCLGIYQMLHEINEIPARMPENSPTRS
ncbi:MAG: heavy metal translocating P-type ATPase metal-binding domain-containing protein [Sulfurisoma sp.]|nr:heavy metal translocating P-type ATPase metal-binding domain-containing protein [Sulfurisoma sp.]